MDHLTSEELKKPMKYTAWEDRKTATYWEKRIKNLKVKGKKHMEGGKQQKSYKVSCGMITDYIYRLTFL